MLRRALWLTSILCVATCARAAPSPSAAPALAAIVDPSRWELQGNARPDRLGGRDCLLLDGGAATVRDLVLRDGVVDADVYTPAARGFFGVHFRGVDDGATGEWIYLRQHKSGQPDAMQYTPVFGTGLNWQLFSGPGFTGAVDIPRDAWFHLRLVVAGATARLYVGDMERPALVVDDLKSDVQRGEVGLVALTGAVCFADVRVRPTADVPWQRHRPPMLRGALVAWQLSPAFDALARDLERPLDAAESARMPWQDVAVEPQPGMQVVYARTRIDVDHAQTRKLSIGYSDDVSVFLNGRILYRGRSAQYFRDPAFLGIVDVENDAVYLPLAAGANELVLAVSELGGGWGFICRLGDAEL